MRRDMDSLGHIFIGSLFLAPRLCAIHNQGAMHPGIVLIGITALLLPIGSEAKRSQSVIHPLQMISKKKSSNRRNNASDIARPTSEVGSLARHYRYWQFGAVGTCLSWTFLCRLRMLQHLDETRKDCPPEPYPRIATAERD